MQHKDTDLRIIIVDDSKDDHFFIKSALSQRKNLKFKSLSNTRDLLHYLLKSGVYDQSDRELPDIVLLDINVPDSKEFETFEILNEHSEFDQISFAILSASGTEDLRDYKNLKVDCYKKPFVVENLRDILEGVIEKHLNLYRSSAA